MAKIVDFRPNIDPIDKDLSSDVLAYVNRRSGEITDMFYEDFNRCLRYNENGAFLGLASLRYLVKRALVEGIKWKESEIR